MNIQFLGTAAAEGFPALFCRCETCKKAAAKGGKNIRTRSGALVNRRVLIDFSPDMYLYRLRYALDLSGITHVFITHSHTDHFDGAELTKRSNPAYCLAPKTPLRVYGNEKVCRLGRESLLFEFGRQTDPSLEFSPLEPFRSVSAEGLVFTPIPAVHDETENCFIYLIREEKTGAAFLYGNDTGLLTKESFDYLSGVRLDGASLDCTFGARDIQYTSHMGLNQNAQFIRELQNRGCVGPGTPLYATHFSHNCGMQHDELEQAAAAFGMGIAFDGMELDIGQG